MNKELIEKIKALPTGQQLLREYGYHNLDVIGITTDDLKQLALLVERYETALRQSDELLNDYRSYVNNLDKEVPGRVMAVMVTISEALSPIAGTKEDHE